MLEPPLFFHFASAAIVQPKDTSVLTICADPLDSSTDPYRFPIEQSMSASPTKLNGTDSELRKAADALELNGHASRDVSLLCRRWNQGPLDAWHGRVSFHD